MHRLATSRSVRSLSRCSESVLASYSTSGSGVGAASGRPSIINNTSYYHTHHNTNNIPSSQRNFSSHDDFSPQKKQNLDDAESSTIHDLIDSHVKGNRIMLYMKGSPSQPMCGFSATVVSILKNSGADFASVNVLDYPEVREGVKKYAQWPTIPQLYVDGEFVGGCDIIKDLDESGELKEMLAGDGGESEKKD